VDGRVELFPRRNPEPGLLPLRSQRGGKPCAARGTKTNTPWFFHYKKIRLLLWDRPDPLAEGRKPGGTAALTSKKKGPRMGAGGEKRGVRCSKIWEKEAHNQFTHCRQVPLFSKGSPPENCRKKGRSFWSKVGGKWLKIVLQRTSGSMTSQKTESKDSRKELGGRLGRKNRPSP